jgi:hypothetical protein
MRPFAAVIATAAVLLTACADQPAQNPPVQVAAVPAKQVCSREVRTGSNVASSVCRRADQANDGQGSDAVDEFSKENQTTLNRMNGGFGR